MNRKSLRRYYVLLLLVLSSAGAITHASIAYTDPLDTEHFRWYDACDGVTDGGTTAKEITYISPLDFNFDPYSWILIDALEKRYGESGWTFDFGQRLGGDITISHYKAYDVHYDYDEEHKKFYTQDGSYCEHGIQMCAYYERVDDVDPLNLDWIQVFTASYNKDGYPAGIPVVDPVPSGDDGKPYYFSDDMDRTQYYYGTPPEEADTFFGDQPHAGHLEADPFSVEVSFSLFLTSVDPLDSKHIYIHDGLWWGYEGICVPEPLSIVLLGSGFFLIRKNSIPGKRK